MKKCPNWKNPGDSVSGWWKYQLLRYLATQFGINTMIETGTANGSACQHLAPHLGVIHTIELSDYYFAESSEKLASLTNVFCYRGDSRKWLPEILSKLSNEPILFWLDAHHSGGFTADAGDPLSEELRIIMKMRPENALIVIDDLRDANMLHIQEAGIDFTGWTREYRTGEVIMYPEGRYKIDPFQEWTE